MKSDKFWIGVFICILVAGLVGSAFVLKKSEHRTVLITRDGKELYRINPDEYKEPYEIEIKYGKSINKVLVDNGRIRMSYADCPDKTCVNMGWLVSDAMPIVCLPHHLVIRYAGDNEDIDGVVN